MNSLFKTVTSNADGDNVVSLSPVEDKEKHQIIIKDLVLDMSIGVLEEEKNKKQRVIVNADVTVQNSIKNDDIATVVSYADIISQIESIANQGHIYLVETFAEKIIDDCLKDNRILAVELSIEKPDIIANAGSVGIKVYKQR